MNDQLSNLSSYFDLMTANGAVRVFQAATELGIFERLAQGPVTVDELAEQRSFAMRPTQLLLDSLAALNLVTEAGGIYSPSPLLELVSGKYRDLGNSYWDHLPTFLRSGEPLIRMDDATANAAMYREQVQSLAWMMQPSAVAAVQAVDVDTGAETVRILDVGCGAAVWSMAFAAAHSNVQVLANDWPPVLDIARQTVGARGVADRYDYLPGNYHEVDFAAAGRFDLILLGNVTHLESPQQNVALFSRLKDALAEDGRLLVFDILPDGKGQLTASLYEMGLALRTQHGQVFTAKALREMLETAGFSVSKSATLPTPPFIMGMIEAWRMKL